MESMASEPQVQQAQHDIPDIILRLLGLPFYITKEENVELRMRAGYLSPSLVVRRATSFDEYTRQLMVPPMVMELVRKVSNLSLSTWEAEGIRRELELEPEGFLRKILKWKFNGITKEEGEGLRLEADNSHPPYIRVACTGKGSFDELAKKYLRDKCRDTHVGKLDYDALVYGQHLGDYGSPVVLEIWPARHYSPIHSHGDTTGIIYCLAGQVDVMTYKELDWNAKKLGLVTLTPGQCAWLTKNTFAVHKVYCPAGSEVTENKLNNISDYAATFHVYLNENETQPESFKSELEHFDPLQARVMSLNTCTKRLIRWTSSILTPTSPGASSAVCWLFTPHLPAPVIGRLIHKSSEKSGFE